MAIGKTWSGIALTMVRLLPADETIPFLLKACREAPPGDAINLLQALAKSGAPEAHAVHREHLERLWKHEGIFAIEPRINRITFAAIYCIKHLLELGESPVEFAEKYRTLLNHPNERYRQHVHNILGKHFPC